MAEELRNRVHEGLVREIGQELNQLKPSITVEDFVLRCMKSWGSLSLSQRISALRSALENFLSEEYTSAREIILQLAPKVQTGYVGIFIPEYISRNGIDNPELALEDLAEVTQYSSSEFAIRPFIERYQERTMEAMLNLTASKNEHVRRLASEGCRPRLLWGRSLTYFIQDPSSIFPILEKLKADQSLYVRKSVANNLNDISKDHPAKVLELAKRWSGHSAHTDWILKRGLRTLLKQGRPEALELFGFRNGQELHLKEPHFSSKEIGWEQELSWDLHIQNPTNTSQQLRLEYKMHFKRKNGSNTKVFQIGEYAMQPKGVLELSRRHLFKELSTRKHQSGTHSIEILLNGISRHQHRFELLAKK